MNKLTKIVAISEILASLAVIISLVYVGAQIRQNTKATQANTAQSLYGIHHDRILVIMGNRELVELKARAKDPMAELNATDSLQLRYDLNLQINLYESAYPNRENGTLNEEMANSWLVSIEEWVCEPVAQEYWEDYRDTYVDGFIVMVDQAFESNTCR